METLKTIGIAGFLFFLIKGLLWLVFFWLVAKGFVSQEKLNRMESWFQGPWKRP